MNENTTIWGIHAGAMGQVDKVFLSKNNPSVAIGWPAMGNLTAVSPDRESFKEKVRTVYPDTKKGAVPTAAGVLYRFTYEIKLQDIIVYPSKTDRKVHIGKVVGEYQYNLDYDKEYPHFRSVKWFKHILRSDFSQGALYEIGSALKPISS